MVPQKTRKNKSLKLVKKVSTLTRKSNREISHRLAWAQIGRQSKPRVKAAKDRTNSKISSTS